MDANISTSMCTYAALPTSARTKSVRAGWVGGGRKTNLVRLAAPGLFVQQQRQAVRQSQHAPGQGVLREQLPAVQAVTYCQRLEVRLPWKPLGPYAEEKWHAVVTPGNHSSSKELEQEVCGLQRRNGRNILINLCKHVPV